MDFHVSPLETVSAPTNVMDFAIIVRALVAPVVIAGVISPLCNVTVPFTSIVGAVPTNVNGNDALAARTVIVWPAVLLHPIAPLFVIVEDANAVPNTIEALMEAAPGVPSNWMVPAFVRFPSIVTVRVAEATYAK